MMKQSRIIGLFAIGIVICVTMAVLEYYKYTQARTQKSAEAPYSEYARAESEAWVGYVTAEVNVRYRKYEDDGLGSEWQVIRDNYGKMVHGEQYPKHEMDRLYLASRAIEKKEGVANIDLMRKLTNEIVQEINDRKFQ